MALGAAHRWAIPVQDDPGILDLLKLNQPNNSGCQMETNELLVQVNSKKLTP
jgi:hypothetical protein